MNKTKYVFEEFREQINKQKQFIMAKEKKESEENAKQEYFEKKGLKHLKKEEVKQTFKTTPAPARVVKPTVKKYSAKLSKEEKIAIMCYEATKTWLELHGELPLPEWSKVPKWHKDSILKGIEYKIANPKATAAKMHNVWVEYRTGLGWSYGKKLDENKKLHPNMVSFNDLNEVEQKKQEVFNALVDALK